MPFLNERTKTEQTDVLAQYLRDDRLHLAKNVEGSNLRKVLIGLACEWLRFRDKVDEIYDEYDINNTTQQRRENVLLKLAGVNATTAKQFENIAAILGFTVTVTNGVDSSTFPMTLPFVLLSEDEAPFTIVVTLDASLEPSGLPLTLPFTLTEQAPAILECFFEKLKPANTIVIFRYS
jgi:uncharacterized protein YmfQ (DUF2313 family)